MSYPQSRPRPLQPPKSRANPLTHVGFSLGAVGACLGVFVDNSYCILIKNKKPVCVRGRLGGANDNDTHARIGHPPYVVVDFSPIFETFWIFGVDLGDKFDVF